jgi:hypothetical protein
MSTNRGFLEFFQKKIQGSDDDNNALRKTAIDEEEKVEEIPRLKLKKSKSMKLAERTDFASMDSEVKLAKILNK